MHDCGSVIVSGQSKIFEAITAMMYSFTQWISYILPV
jgi:hypothetical protein